MGQWKFVGFGEIECREVGGKVGMGSRRHPTKFTRDDQVSTRGNQIPLGGRWTREQRIPTGQLNGGFAQDDKILLRGSGTRGGVESDRCTRPGSTSRRTRDYLGPTITGNGSLTLLPLTRAPGISRRPSTSAFHAHVRRLVADTRGQGREFSKSLFKNFLILFSFVKKIYIYFLQYVLPSFRNMTNLIELNYPIKNKKLIMNIRLRKIQKVIADMLTFYI